MQSGEIPLPGRCVRYRVVRGETPRLTTEQWRELFRQSSPDAIEELFSPESGSDDN